MIIFLRRGRFEHVIVGVLLILTLGGDCYTAPCSKSGGDAPVQGLVLGLAGFPWADEGLPQMPLRLPSSNLSQRSRRILISYVDRVRE